MTTTTALVLAAGFVLTPARLAVVADTSADDRAEIVAEIEVAMAAWEASCRKPGDLGLCVSIATPAADPAAGTCSAPKLGAVAVTSRGAAGKKAHARLRELVRRADEIAAPKEPADKAAYDAVIGRARLALADHDLERYLSLHIPGNLDFFVEEFKRDAKSAKERAEYRRQVEKRDASTKKFKAFLVAKSKDRTALTKAYATGRFLGDPRHVLAAALKSAWVSQNFADELLAAPVPESLSAPEMAEAYCNALAGEAVAWQKIAQEATAWCIDRADEQGVTGPIVDDCRELAARYPTAE